MSLDNLIIGAWFIILGALTLEILILKARICLQHQTRALAFLAKTTANKLAQALINCGQFTVGVEILKLNAERSKKEKRARGIVKSNFRIST